MPRHVLVTGAGGTTGSALVSLLAETDHDIRAGVHTPDRVATRAPFDRETVEVVELDFTRPATIEAAVEGVDSVYLLTPFASTMVQMVTNAVEAAVAADVGQIVRHSALGASDDPPFRLAEWHRRAEERVEESGIEYTHLRPTAFMQNLLGEADRIRDSGTITNPVGAAAIAHVDARDVARVGRTVLVEDGHEGRAYPITGPEALTYDEIATRLAERLDREIESMRTSSTEVRGALLELGMPEELVEGFLGLQAWFSDGHGAEVFDTVESVTGTPARTIDQFLDDYADAFR